MTTTVAGDRRPAGPKYRFSLERLEELNRSPVPLLLARLNTACPSFGKSAAEIADPADLIDEIRAHCADDSDFIRSAMPLQEIVFRTLLLNGDEPMALADLHRELIERWSTPLRPISVTMGGLARVLDSDLFYGFAAVLVAEPETAEEPHIPSLAAADADEAALLDEIVASLAADFDDEEEDEDSDLYEDDDAEEGDEDEDAEDDYEED